MTTATDLTALKYDLEQSGRWYTEEGQQEYKRACFRAIDDALATSDPSYAAMLAAERDELPAIQIRRCPESDGTDFIIDLGNDDHVTVYVPDARNDNPHDRPQLLIFGHDGENLEDATRVLSAGLVLLKDPRVIAAREQWEASEIVAITEALEAPRPTLTLEIKESDWYRYTYGTAQLGVEEDEDGTIKYLNLLVGGHELELENDEAAMRDLIGLLHHHSVQNTLNMLICDDEGIAPLSTRRPEWDNGTIQDYERSFSAAMVRMGLSAAQQRDLMEHVESIAGAIDIQAMMRGYKEALKRLAEELEAGEKAA